MFNITVCVVQSWNCESTWSVNPRSVDPRSTDLWSAKYKCPFFLSLKGLYQLMLLLYNESNQWLLHRYHPSHIIFINLYLFEVYMTSVEDKGYNSIWDCYWLSCKVNWYGSQDIQNMRIWIACQGSECKWSMRNLWTKGSHETWQYRRSSFL